MGQAARNGDSTIGFCDDDHKCCSHSRHGTCNRGSPNVFINGRSAYRLGDQGDCKCPHGGKFVGLSGSATVYINGRQAVRNRDCTMCAKCASPGVVTSGSANVLIGD